MTTITEKTVRRNWEANPDMDFDGLDIGVLLAEIDRLRALNADLLAACEATMEWVYENHEGRSVEFVDRTPCHQRMIEAIDKAKV